jgi:uncharacterized membrane protein YoaK (UPF0700 family)
VDNMTGRRRSKILNGDDTSMFGRRLSSLYVDVVDIDRAGLDIEISSNNSITSSDDDQSQTISYKKDVSWRTRVSNRSRKFFEKAHKKVFGDKYFKRESGFVILAGALIALNSGLVNGSCMSGFLFPEGESVSIAGFTSDYTQSGLAMAAGNWSTYSYHSYFIFSYILGAFISGLVTPDATPYRIEPTYGPTFLVGGFFLLTASILTMLEYEPTLVFFFAAASNGIQNGIASIYSANLVRCSLTGATTDLALVAAQILRGNRKGTWKGFVLAIIVVSFWTGGLISFFLTRRYRSHTIFFNSCLCFLIVLSLVVCLAKEIGISFQTALFGTWRWKKAIGKLHKRVTCCEESKELPRIVCCRCLMTLTMMEMAILTTMNHGTSFYWRISKSPPKKFEHSLRVWTKTAMA